MKYFVRCPLCDQLLHPEAVGREDVALRFPKHGHQVNRNLTCWMSGSDIELVSRSVTLEIVRVPEAS